MQVIMTALGSRGDLYPVLGFGQAIRERGHSVRVITTGNFKSEVAEAGLDYVDLCDGPTYEEITRMLSKYGKGGKKALAPEDYRALETLFSLTPGRLFRLIQEHHIPGSTILATPEIFTFGIGTLAREKLGIPYVAVRHLAGMFRAVTPWLGPPLLGVDEWLKNVIASCIWITRQARRNYLQFRSELGLPATKNFIRAWWRSEQLNIGLFPNWFGPWEKVTLPRTLLTGFPLYETEAGGELPPELEEFLTKHERPIVFTNASWRTDLEDFITSSIAASEALGMPAVILAQHISSVQFPSRPNVIALEYAPLKLLLPRAAAIVHHGGLGTIARAMAHGTPQLVVPGEGGTDQSFNAATVKKLEVGLRVSSRRYRRDALEALRTLLNSSTIRESSQRHSQLVAKGPNYELAITRMEQLVPSSRGQPVREHHAAELADVGLRPPPNE